MRRYEGHLTGGGTVTAQRLLPVLAVLVLLLVLLPVASAAEGDEPADTGVLKGQVLNLHYDSGVPQVYIVVESDGGYLEATTTNEEGEYRFELPYGYYTMRVLHRDEEIEVSTGIFIDPTPMTRDILLNLTVDTPVQLHGVIKVDGVRASKDRVVFDGVGNSFLGETVTDGEGRYSIDVPYGRVKVKVYEGEDYVGRTEIGPFVEAGYRVVPMDVSRTGAPPSISDWTEFLSTTWTGLAIWLAVVVGLVALYVFTRRWVYGWLEGGRTRFSRPLSEMVAYAVRGYLKAVLLYASWLVLDLTWNVASEVAASWIAFWLYSLVLMIILWVSARLLLMLVDYLMGRLRAQRKAAGSEIPEAAFIFIHGILRYALIAIFGFFILLILLSGAGLYDQIAGGFTGFISTNVAYLLLLVLIVVVFFITQRFVRLTLEQMKETSTKFSPQMLGIFGLIARVLTIFIFSVMFLFTLLTMAGMQEMGALIMALLTAMVGMIVAMTTTGAVGNGLSGMVLLSLRPFDKDDWVIVADESFGQVVEVTTFFTRLRSLNNELVEIPNNLVLAREIKNLSREGHVGLEVDLGIGYDVPSDVVLSLLKKGAKGTKDILRDPKPQTLVMRFGDYAVYYRLRAFTDAVDRYYQTKSSLMENLQELFYTEGIEIMTPWQMVRREEDAPCSDEVIQRYAEKLKHKDSTQGKETSIAAGMEMLDSDSKPKEEET